MLRIVRELQLEQIHDFPRGLYRSDMSDLEGNFLLHSTFLQRVQDVELEIWSAANLPVMAKYLTFLSP